LRQLKFSIALAILVAILLTGVAFAQDFPQPTGRLVNDFAGVLSPGAEAQLENRLLQLEKDTTDEVAVVTVVSLEDSPIEDYASELFQKWGIGKKGKDNGVLFIVAPNERKVWIEVGYGLEPVLTDGRSGRILDNEVLPGFREGDYETGITNGVIAIEGYLRTPLAPLQDNPVRRAVSTADFLPPLLIGLGIASIYIFGFMARSKSIWLGGIWGGGVGAVLGLVAGGLLGLILFTIGLTGLGLFLDWLLSRNYKATKSLGHSTGWGSTWGGFRGPYGGFGGGSFGGGGGFHFGGGASGGGGAGRGW